MRIFLAATHEGMSVDTRKKLIERGKPRYILETFFNGEKKCKNALENVGTENFLLDSGAFSFMSGAECTKEMLMEYLDRYIKFIRDNDIRYFFELDVDTIFGIEFVEMMRRKLEGETQKQCIPVWHKGRGVEYWKQMCDRYKYVAIGGLVFHVKKQEYELIKKMVNYAYHRGVKVHGLGFTKTKELKNWKFYSVDSASWAKAAGRGQQRNDFNGKSIDARRIGGNGKKIYLSELICHNGIEWCKYQRYMDSQRW